MTTEDEVKPARPSFFRRYRVVILIVLVCLVLQSFTISLPISGRIVDEQGRPIANAEIAALWLVEMYGIIDMAPAGAVKVSHVRSDEQGRYHLPGAVIVHTPLFPFSYLMRTHEMPELVVAVPEYDAGLAANDYFGLHGPPSPGGFWFVRASSLRGFDVKMRRLDDLRGGSDNLSIARFAIERAENSCRRRWACNPESLDSVIKTIRDNEYPQ